MDEAGGRTRPIEIQKKIGLRQLQNRMKLPRRLAILLARAFCFRSFNKSGNQRAFCLFIDLAERLIEPKISRLH